MAYICNTNKPRNKMKKQMTFREIIESEFYYLVEAIEWGSSDPEVIENCKKELEEKTGYKYI